MTKKIEPNKLVNYIMDFEGGNMTLETYFAFFGHLIKTGQAWTLQGMYGRQAQNLIDNGLINKKGEVQWKVIKEKGIDTKQMLYRE